MKAYDGPTSNMLYSLTSSIYQMLTDVSDYSAFATVTGSNGSLANLEAPHGGIHSMVGGFGHMTDFTVSSYDPIFWLHHW